MHVVVTRPLEDAKKTAQKLIDRGQSPIIAPMMTVVPLIQPKIPKDTFQAIAVTSSNAIEQLKRHPKFSKISSLPVYTVGDACAKEAKKAGFTSVYSARGDKDALIDFISHSSLKKEIPILYAAGKQRYGELGEDLNKLGYPTQTKEFYSVEPVDELPISFTSALQAEKIDVILLYSFRSAQIYVNLVKQAQLVDKITKLNHVCLSERVANPLEQLTIMRNQIHISPHPNQDDMLSMLSPEILRN